MSSPADETSGRQNVYVQSFPSGSPKWRVSADGGSIPRWSQDSRQLFYRRGQSIFAVEMGREDRASPGRPREILATAVIASGQIEYDVDPQAQRFAVVAGVENVLRDMPPITLLVNWTDRLRK